MNTLKCQVCSQTAKDGNIMSCGYCHSGYYCSQDCQKKDWEEHYKHVCSLLKVDGDFVANPWFSQTSPRDPKVVVVPGDSDLIDAATNGNAEKLLQCIERNALLNVVRGSYGETTLHLAVISGNLEAVKCLVQAGVCINANDSRGNSAFYYACTHPGKDDILKTDQRKRMGMVSYLIEIGADTMQYGGFSGKRPFEMARSLGYADTADLIQSSVLHHRFKMIRNKTNQKELPRSIEKVVRKFVDVTWREISAQWFIQTNRNGMLQCTKPHPQMIAKHNGTPESIEMMFKDCAARRQKWWEYVKTMTDSQN